MNQVQPQTLQSESEPESVQPEAAPTLARGKRQHRGHMAGRLWCPTNDNWVTPTLCSVRSQKYHPHYHFCYRCKYWEAHLPLATVIVPCECGEALVALTEGHSVKCPYCGRVIHSTPV